MDDKLCQIKTSLMQCEGCLSEKNVHKSVIGNNEFEMSICDRCLKRIVKYHFTNGELLYIHNNYISGNKKRFIK
jgi:hypothetical protein